MKNTLRILFASLVLSVAPGLRAAVTVSHVENAGAGQFFTSGGVALAAGGVSIGYFTSAPLDSAFGTTINSWADLLAAGYTDVRSTPGATTSGGFDWDFPLAVGGSTQNIPVSSLASGTQLYVVAFDAGTYNIATPATSFTGATSWAVVKDLDNAGPADLGLESIVLSNAVGSEVLRGTDNGINVNMTSLSAGPVPEPSRLMFLGIAGLGLILRRRRC